MANNVIGNVKPKKVYLNFKFECDKCGHDIYMSFKEAKQIGRAVCEFCQHLVVMKPIKGVDIKIHYNDNIEQKPHIKKTDKSEPITKPFGKISPKINSQFINKEKNIINEKGVDDGVDDGLSGLSDVFNCLKTLGYKSADAARRIEKAVYILGGSASHDEITKKALSL